MAHLLFLPILQLLLLYCTKSAQAQLNISIGSSLTPQGVNNSWISPSADFAFGFRAVDGNSSSYLLAVWFNKIADKTVVWYARTSSNGKDDTIPVQVQSGSVLKLADGALSLRDPSGNEAPMAQQSGSPLVTLLIPSYPHKCFHWGRHSTAVSSPQTIPMADFN
uniref:Bulb-type lectin domain-containing protein n=1 Tax=Oryza rufipogon TaxID=4529 RepID=A0A0E0P5U3_ORYRU